MDQASGMGQGSNDLAQERTRLAKDKTSAAIVRTVHEVITKLRAQGLEEPRWIITMTTLLLLITAIMRLPLQRCQPIPRRLIHSTNS